MHTCAHMQTHTLSHTLLHTNSAISMMFTPNLLNILMEKCNAVLDGKIKKILTCFKLTKQKCRKERHCQK